VNGYTIFVAIDTPALMESRGEWAYLHERHNSFKLIADMFKEAYEGLDEPRLVVFVPVRCERYVQDAADTARLVERVKEGYRETFEILSGKRSVAVVIAPVQTVGSVVFLHIGARTDPQKKPTPDDYEFYFKRSSPDARYAPKDNEQPLRYMLRFLLNEHLKEKRRERLGGAIDEIAQELGWTGFWTSPFGEFFDEIEGHAPFRDAVASFAEGCKESTPFEIVQGRDVLG
jgi:hypothetical protein